MSKLPETCVGCPEAESIANRPITSWQENVEERTGEKVARWGGPFLVESPEPTGAWYAGERPVPGPVLSSAVLQERRNRSELAAQVADYVADCPGLCDVSVRLSEEITAQLPEGRAYQGAVQLQVCGKSVVQAAIEQATPQPPNA